MPRLSAPLIFCCQNYEYPIDDKKQKPKAKMKKPGEPNVPRPDQLSDNSTIMDKSLEQPEDAKGTSLNTSFPDETEEILTEK